MLSYGITIHSMIAHSLIVVRNTAVELGKKNEVLPHEIYKNTIGHASNKDKSFSANTNAKHQRSNNMAKEVFKKNNSSASKNLHWCCSMQGNNECASLSQTCLGSAPVFLSPDGDSTGFQKQGKLVRKNQEKHS